MRDDADGDEEHRPDRERLETVKRRPDPAHAPWVGVRPGVRDRGAGDQDLNSERRMPARPHANVSLRVRVLMRSTCRSTWKRAVTAIQI